MLTDEACLNVVAVCNCLLQKTVADLHWQFMGENTIHIFSVTCLSQTSARNMPIFSRY